MIENVAPRRRKRRSRLPMIIGLLVIAGLIGGGGFLVWRYVTRPQPEVAVRKLLAAVKTGNEAAVKSNLTQSNLQMLAWFHAQDQLPGIISAVSNYLVGKGFEEGRQYTLEVSSVKKDTAIVTLKAGPDLDDSKPARVLKSLKHGVPFVVVKEGEEWKVDLVSTYPSLIGPLQKQGVNLQDMMGISR